MSSGEGGGGGGGGWIFSGIAHSFQVRIELEPNTVNSVLTETSITWKLF